MLVQKIVRLNNTNQKTKSITYRIKRKSIGKLMEKTSNKNISKIRIGFARYWNIERWVRFREINDEINDLIYL